MSLSISSFYRTSIKLLVTSKEVLPTTTQVLSILAMATKELTEDVQVRIDHKNETLPLAVSFRELFQRKGSGSRCALNVGHLDEILMAAGELPKTTCC